MDLNEEGSRATMFARRRGEKSCFRIVWEGSVWSWEMVTLGRVSRRGEYRRRKWTTCFVTMFWTFCGFSVGRRVRKSPDMGLDLEVRWGGTHV